MNPLMGHRTEKCLLVPLPLTVGHSEAPKALSHQGSAGRLGCGELRPFPSPTRPRRSSACGPHSFSQVLFSFC